VEGSLKYISGVLPETSHEFHVLYLWHKVVIKKNLVCFCTLLFYEYCAVSSRDEVWYVWRESFVTVVNDDSEGTWREQSSRYAFRIIPEALKKIIFSDIFETYHRAPPKHSLVYIMRFTLLGPSNLCFPNSCGLRLPWYE
jgi:hypothetical protein